MKTRNVGKKRLRRTEGYKHKLGESRDKKKEHSPYIPLFLVMSLAVVLLFVGIGVASATDYYVATWGSDSNPGTEAQPWKTIQKAANTLIAGDIVYIKEGTYNEQVTPQNSGSSGNYITYIAYPGHSVIIDGFGLSITFNHGIFDIKDKSYIRVSGLKVINSEDRSIMMYNSHHIIIAKNYVYNCVGPGIAAGAASNNIIIDGNEVDTCSLTSCESISLVGVDTFEIKNNHVHDTPKEGIDTKCGCSNGKIYGNHLHNCAAGIYVDAYADDEHNIDVYQNIVHNCSGAAISLATEEGGTLENINVHNNILYNNHNGFTIHSYVKIATGSHLKKNIKVINNIFYNNTLNIHITERDNKFENFVIRNNILIGEDWGMIAITYIPHFNILKRILINFFFTNTIKLLAHIFGFCISFSAFFSP